MTERRKHPAARTRIATAGIGLAAMAALVSKMEITANRADAASPSSTAGASGAAATRHAGATVKPREYAAAASKPAEAIVLTPHAVVHTVTVGGSGGGGYSGSPSVAAAAPVSAPVASSGGSHP